MIQKETGIEPELVAGAGGIFDIRADGNIAYAKSQTGRFPEDEEVLGAIRRLMK